MRSNDRSMSSQKRSIKSKLKKIPQIVLDAEYNLNHAVVRGDYPPEEILYLRHTLWLRKAGCRCNQPLLGYRPEVGPRCRLCNTVASEQ